MEKKDDNILLKIPQCAKKEIVIYYFIQSYRTGEFDEY